MSATNGHDTLHIPVIDISRSTEQTGYELVDAAVQYGFVFVKSSGLGLDVHAVNQMFDISRKFFQSPREEKQKYGMQKNNRGWTAMHEEVLDPETDDRGDPKEGFNFGEFENGKAHQPLPPDLQAHEAQLSRFSKLCRELAMKLLELFAIGLKIDPAEGGANWFSSRHEKSKGPSGTILRILYYPSSTTTPSRSPIRAGAHSDYGSLTLLFRLPGQPGLEILDPSQNWVSVPVLPPGTEDDPFPPILVNIGDLLSYWTGGLLKSTVHRVVGPSTGVGGEGNRGMMEDRYSIAYFFHPCTDTELVSVPSERVRERMKGREQGKTVTAIEHLNGRLAATYGWGTEEVAGAGIVLGQRG
ncbi:hypothetical protein MMC11_006949 [Xylographa trunciseda]|nr:hypothetical protein [Xylographa trunciseda]